MPFKNHSGFVLQLQTGLVCSGHLLNILPLCFYIICNIFPVLNSVDYLVDSASCGKYLRMILMNIFLRLVSFTFFLVGHCVFFITNITLFLVWVWHLCLVYIYQLFCFIFMVCLFLLGPVRDFDRWII